MLLLQAEEDAKKAAKEIFYPEEEEEKPAASSDTAADLSIVQDLPSPSVPAEIEMQPPAVKKRPEVAIAGIPASSGLQPGLNTSNAASSQRSKDTAPQAKPPERYRELRSFSQRELRHIREDY